MQIDRLFQMIYLLLGREKMTAGELSRRFEVSERTIYRDIDTLSSAGIPIYATKGKGGGIGLLPEFVLNKSVLSEKEQNEILFGLQSLSATNAAESGAVLLKLSSLFHKEEQNWIDVDFSNWGSGVEEREKFQHIKIAILERFCITFSYFSANGAFSQRMVEPVKLRFKNNNWYLQGFCLEKQTYRTFKIKRMQSLHLTEQTFERRPDVPPPLEPAAMAPACVVPLRLWFEKTVAYRVYDSFDLSQVEQQPDGSFIVSVMFPQDDWVYGFLLSFGEQMRILEPASMKDIIKGKAIKMLELYK